MTNMLIEKKTNKPQALLTSMARTNSIQCNFDFGLETKFSTDWRLDNQTMSKKLNEETKATGAVASRTDAVDPALVNSLQPHSESIDTFEAKITMSPKKEYVDDSEKWESGELGASEEHTIPAPKEHKEKLDAALGMQMISIRLQKKVIDQYKEMAEEDGIGYQTLMRMALNRYMKDRSKSKTTAGAIRR